jgi:glutamine synthetase
MRRELDPPPPVEADPYASQNPMLPTSLADAIGALEKDSFYREAFGDTLVDYLLQMKKSENGRYEAAIAESPLADAQDVSDWEMREYFEFY